MFEFIERRFFPRDANTAEDVVQATFLKLYTVHAQYDRSKPFRPWLFSLAANHALYVSEKNGYRNAASIHGKKSIDLEDYRGVQNESLRASVDELPDDERQAVDLIYFQGMKFREAATELGVADGTVKTRIHRALQRLRESMGKDLQIPAAA
jgi:RNA polymerase sigma-70 factor (ECF subfamily)